MGRMDDITGDEEFHIDHNSFKLGKAIGMNDMYRELVQAVKMDELDLFLECYRNKTLEEWEKWADEHGSVSEFTKRWKQ